MPSIHDYNYPLWLGKEPPEPPVYYACSLYQPWASLVVLGLKKFETRTWVTHKRCPIVIHASKQWDAAAERLTNHFCELLESDVLWTHPLGVANDGSLNRIRRNVGVALGMVTIVDVYRSERIRDRLSDLELAFGNYDDGRAIWELSSPRGFVQPVAARGAMGLWQWKLPLPAFAA